MSPRARAIQKAQQVRAAQKRQMVKPREAALVKRDRVRDYQTGLVRTANLPPMPPVPEGLPLDEWAVSISVGANLIRTTYQNLFQITGRHECPAYRHEGRRVVLVSDLVETQAARAQADRVAEHARLEAMSLELHQQPAWLTGSAAHPDWCTVCHREEHQTEDPAD